MKHILNLCMFLVVLMTGGYSSYTYAQEDEPIMPLKPPVSAETGDMINDTPELWFVELGSLPLADGGRIQDLRKDKTDFRNEAARSGIRYVERLSFDRLWNGLSISISSVELGKLARLSSVKNIYPVETLRIPESEVLANPEMATALAMTGADIAQSELGLTGAGIRVAVMDTGIDYTHPDLGGCFGSGCRVETGYDFVGNAFDGQSPGSPDEDPMDCNGHGTHVAGIIGAHGDVVGVAPGVVFGAYKVFGCTGSTTADVMLAAMERALADGMQVLNMSIGAAFEWPQYPTAQGADRLVNSGMVVVASIGNSGANGIYSAGAPGVGRKVIGVASFDNTDVTLSAFEIIPDNRFIGYGLAAGSVLPPTDGSLDVARTGTPTSTEDACNTLEENSLLNQAALIRRGTCSFYAKAWNAQQAGASAVVLYNNVAGRFSPTVAGEPPITIPVVAISDQDGILINNLLDAGSVTLNWTEQSITTLNPTGGLISDFSAYGLAPDLTLKPDIGAPGGLIRSTYPVAMGSYATMSGTSMSAPHVSGSVALLLEALPNTPAQAVRGILQNSAEPKNWWGNPSLGFLDNVHRQGAGMINIPGAVQALARIEPAKLSLGESEIGPATHLLTIENKSGQSIRFNLSHVPALATGPNTFTPSFFLSSASVSYSVSNVEVPANGAATVTATITAPSLPEGGLYGGYLVFTAEEAEQVYRVPYSGYIGDYQARDVITPTDYGFPWLASMSGGGFWNEPDGATYSMVGDDVPFILVHLDHQARLLRMTVADANTGRSWHRAYDLNYVSRNSTSTSFFAFPWDGMTVNGKKVYVVPNGAYVIELSVLKALGDSGNPDHWETWTSPVITISR